METGIKKIRPSRKIPVFLLTCSKILRLEGRKKILFLKIFLASLYRGHILTLINGIKKKLGSVGLAETPVIFFLSYERS